MFAALSAGACGIHTGCAFAQSYTDIADKREISSGSEITTDRIRLQGGHLRYTTPAVDTLQSVLEVNSGTISVATGGTLTVNFEWIDHGATLNLGAQGDDGTIVIDRTRLTGASPLPILNIQSGTVTFGNAPGSVLTTVMQSVAVADGATVAYGGRDASLSNLSGLGTVDSGGGDLVVRGAFFRGEIQNVAALTFLQRDAMLGGALENVGSVAVGSGLRLTVLESGTADDFASIDSVSLGGGSIFDFTSHNVQLNNVQGGGTLGTAGTVIINGGNFSSNIITPELIFRGNTTWSGSAGDVSSVMVSSGATLTTTGGSTFSAASNLVVDGTYRVAATETIGTLTGAGRVDIGTGQNLTVGSNNASYTFAGEFSGGGMLIKAGTGTLTLTGTANHAGGTYISNGTLVGDAESLAGNIVNNAALVFDQATDGAFAGNISGGGSLTKSGAGTLTLKGSSSHTGGTTISAGTL
ncbi:autotransporter-associated beta strand repeat-containing protein, partial [Chelativorans sp.]|uniref:autotransporter-associated beta strand repeat-containing protein n=1 Tax=Chelativorans sp. TaxID=2203393 RepID=UPI0028111E75